jgi:hypothetical protein
MASSPKNQLKDTDDDNHSKNNNNNNNNNKLLMINIMRLQYEL